MLGKRISGSHFSTDFNPFLSGKHACAPQIDFTSYAYALVPSLDSTKFPHYQLEVLTSLLPGISHEHKQKRFRVLLNNLSQFLLKIKLSLLHLITRLTGCSHTSRMMTIIVFSKYPVLALNIFKGFMGKPHLLAFLLSIPRLLRIQ